MKHTAFIQTLCLGNGARALAAIVVAALVAFQDPVAFAQSPGPSSAYPSTAAPGTVSASQLDSLVSPIALYPDPLLTQVLVASTYPQEVAQAYQWVTQNPGLQGKALVDAAVSQPWDPSIQALVAFPQVLGMMSQNMTWTTQLGQAFLSQQAGVFDSVQRMRQLAQQHGALQSTAQQRVTTVSENGQPYIEIQPANPEVAYVPQYQPEAIWGPSPVYAYPEVVYPSTGALITTGLLSFGTGVAIGAIFNGGWGWYPGWGSHNVYINNNFFANNRFNRANVGRGGQWIHNPNRGRGQFGGLRPGTLPSRQGTAGRQGLPGAGGRPGLPGTAGGPRVNPLQPGAARGGYAGRLGPGATTPRLGPGSMQRLGNLTPAPHRGTIQGGRQFGNMGARYGSSGRVAPTPHAMPRMGAAGGFHGANRFGGASRSFGGGRRSFGGGGRSFGGGRRGGGRRR